MMPATYAEVRLALTRMGRYRVRRAQEVALDGEPDGIGGALLLSLGLRETWGTNIEGGAKLVNGRWVPEDDPRRMDVGWLQISRRYHPDSLRLMPGVKAGTWGPTVEGKTANDGGYVPRFTDALRFTIDEMREAIAYAEDNGVEDRHLARFAVAAHNAGQGGAIKGYREGNVDKYTAGGDYSKWVMNTIPVVREWIKDNPNYKWRSK